MLITLKQLKVLCDILFLKNWKVITLLIVGQLCTALLNEVCLCHLLHVQAYCLLYLLAMTLVFEFTTLMYENIFIQISKIDFFYFKTSYIFFITKFKNIKCHYLFLSTYFATVLS